MDIALFAKVTLPLHRPPILRRLATGDAAFRARVETFIDGLVSHYVLDGGKLVVAHAGMREELAGRASGRVQG